VQCIHHTIDYNESLMVTFRCQVKCITKCLFYIILSGFFLFIRIFEGKQKLFLLFLNAVNGIVKIKRNAYRVRVLYRDGTGVV